MSGDSLYIKRNRAASATIHAIFQRPNNTTTYTANTVVNATTAIWLTFQKIARKVGGGAIIQGATLIDEAAQTLKPELELYLFDTYGTPQADNAALAVPRNEVDTCIGMIQFPSALTRTMNTGAGATSGICCIDGISKSIACGPNVRDIYGVLVVRNAYVPIANEKFTVRLHVIQD